jgi:serine/threonine protein kinase
MSPQKIHQYKILDKLGSGSQAFVYRAVSSIGEKFALKILSFEHLETVYKRG